MVPFNPEQSASPARSNSSSQGARLAYPPAEVAALVGLSRSKVMALLASSEIPSVKVGRARRILHTDVVAWLDGLKRT